MIMFNLEVRKQYEIEITNRMAALENLSDMKEVHGAWKNVKENIKKTAEVSVGLHELKQHMLWFEEESLVF